MATVRIEVELPESVKVDVEHYRSALGSYPQNTYGHWLFIPNDAIADQAVAKVTVTGETSDGVPALVHNGNLEMQGELTDVLADLPMGDWILAS